MKQEVYEVNEKEFWIVDEELGIDLRSEIEFVDRGYFPKGEIRYETFRKGEKLHGPSTFYGEAGEILSHAWFYEGMKVGKAYRYYPNGQIYSIEKFVNGVSHLEQQYFYLDGTLKTTIGFDRGIFHGETKLFWPDGILKRKCSFSHGEKEEDQFYDEEGSLIGATETAIS